MMGFIQNYKIGKSFVDEDLLVDLSVDEQADGSIHITLNNGVWAHGIETTKENAIAFFEETLAKLEGTWED